MATGHHGRHGTHVLWRVAEEPKTKPARALIRRRYTAETIAPDPDLLARRATRTIVQVMTNVSRIKLFELMQNRLNDVWLYRSKSCWIFTFNLSKFCNFKSEDLKNQKLCLIVVLEENIKG